MTLSTSWPGIFLLKNEKLWQSEARTMWSSEIMSCHLVVECHVSWRLDESSGILSLRFQFGENPPYIFSKREDPFYQKLHQRLSLYKTLIWRGSSVQNSDSWRIRPIRCLSGKDTCHTFFFSSFQFGEDPSYKILKWRESFSAGDLDSGRIRPKDFTSEILSEILIWWGCFQWKFDSERILPKKVWFREDPFYQAMLQRGSFLSSNASERIPCRRLTLGVK